MEQEEKLDQEIISNEPNISQLFNKYRNEGGSESKNEPRVKEEKLVAREETKEKKEKLTIKKDKEAENKEADTSKEKSIDWKIETEKLQRDLKETQRWAVDTKRQISSYKKAIEKFKEDGILSDDEAVQLLDHTKYEELAEREKPFLVKAGEVWDKEIENIRKYSDYEDLDKHIHAFQHFLHNGEAEEIKEVYEDLKDLIDSNPVAFTKKMLQIGKNYHEEIFGEFSKAGNLKNFKNQYESKISEYQKKIDKLEKDIHKLKQRYEDYDENPNYRIPQGGDNNSGIESDSMKRPGNLIEKFNQGQYRLTG